MNPAVTNQLTSPPTAPLLNPATLAAPPSAPSAPLESPTAPVSFTHLPDGSWADAQVQLSAEARATTATPTAASPTPSTEAAPLTPEQQAKLLEEMTNFYQTQIAMDNLMFEQQMMMIQQRATLSNAMAMRARNNTSSVFDLKPVSPPDLKLVAHSDDEGGGEE